MVAQAGPSSARWWCSSVPQAGQAARTVRKPSIIGPCPHAGQRRAQPRSSAGRRSRGSPRDGREGHGLPDHTGAPAPAASRAHGAVRRCARRKPRRAAFDPAKRTTRSLEDDPNSPTDRRRRSWSAGSPPPASPRAAHGRADARMDGPMHGHGAAGGIDFDTIDARRRRHAHPGRAAGAREPSGSAAADANGDGALDRGEIVRGDAGAARAARAPLRRRSRRGARRPAAGDDGRDRERPDRGGGAGRAAGQRPAGAGSTPTATPRSRARRPRRWRTATHGRHRRDGWREDDAAAAAADD